MSTNYHTITNEIQECDSTPLSDEEQNKKKIDKKKTNEQISDNWINAVKFKQIPKIGHYAFLRVFTVPKGINKKIVPDWTPDKNNGPFKVIDVQGITITLFDRARKVKFTDHLDNVRIVPEHMDPKPVYVKNTKKNPRK